MKYDNLNSEGWNLVHRMSNTQSATFTILAAAMFLGALGGTHAATAPSGGQSPQFEDGQVLAQRQCGFCHAIGTSGASPRPDAPPFRRILRRYRADVLEQELVEGIKLGHPDMPRFQLNPRSVSGLIVYLRAIQEEELVAKRPALSGG